MANVDPNEVVKLAKQRWRDCFDPETTNPVTITNSGEDFIRAVCLQEIGKFAEQLTATFNEVFKDKTGP